MHATTSLRQISLASLLALGAASHAAPPDAGQLLRQETDRDKAPAAQLPPTLPAAAPEKIASDAGPVLPVTSFRIVGLQTLSDAQVQAMLASYAGQSYSINGLHRVAEKLEQWLRAQGLFTARAYLPPQDIQGGVVELRVLEGRVEGIDIKRAPGTRLSDDTLRALLAGALPPGAALEQARLERGLLITNDMPATSARAVLVPGKELGGSRVLVEAAQGPVVSGSAELDNTGNRFTGEWRAGAALYINDPSGRGDQWSLRGAASQGTSFVRAGYTLPVGSNGMKAGVSFIDSHYKLCCNLSAGAPESDGDANAMSAFISYPYVRTLQHSLSVSANLANRGFVNRSNGGKTSDKKTDSLTLALSGDKTDLTGLTGLGGYTTYGVQWTTGELNLDGWQADRQADKTTYATHGAYDKLTGQLSHLLRLTQTTALYASVSAQWAGKNLDSAEKFVLGGPSGVRAYPAGEGSGDEGWLASAEWRRQIDRTWSMVAFVDVGEVQLHRTTYTGWNATNTGINNHYALSGVGASVVWSPVIGRQITATLATRLNDNPGRDAAGRDSDNQEGQPRLWLQGSVAF